MQRERARGGVDASGEGKERGGGVRGDARMPALFGVCWALGNSAVGQEGHAALGVVEVGWVVTGGYSCLQLDSCAMP